MNKESSQENIYFIKLIQVVNFVLFVLIHKFHYFVRAWSRIQRWRHWSFLYCPERLTLQIQYS